MGDDDDLEFTILNKKDVLVYQIPPASSSSGHKADDWKKCIWRGRCRVVGKGKDLYIKLLDPSSGNLFAQCAVPGGDHEKYVERVVDSSRYFVLKITNADRHAFIGLGFEDRNDAFDFNVALADFKSTWVDKGGDQPEASTSTAYTPSQDFSLKEGQKIQVKIAGMEGRRRRDNGDQAGGDLRGFAGLLAPPPPAGGTRRAEVAAAPAVPAVHGGAPAQGAAFGDDDFGDFSAAPAAPAPAAGPPPPGPDPFGFAPAVPAAAPAAPSPMGFADPFAASAPTPAPAFAAPALAPAFSMGAPAPAPSGGLGLFGAPPGAPAPGPAGPALGFAGLGDPFGAPAQVAPAASADPFANINAGLGIPASKASPPQQPSYLGFAAPAPPKPAQSSSNAFDDLDIFK